MKLVPYHPISPSFFIVRAPYCWPWAVGRRAGIGGRQKTHARKKKHIKKKRRDKWLRANIIIQPGCKISLQPSYSPLCLTRFFWFLCLSLFSSLSSTSAFSWLTAYYNTCSKQLGKGTCTNINEGMNE